VRPPKVAHTVVTEKPQANVKRKDDSSAAVLCTLEENEDGGSPLPKGEMEADLPASTAAITTAVPVRRELPPPPPLPPAEGVGAEEQLTGEEYWNNKWYWHNNIEQFEQRLSNICTSFFRE